MKLILNANIFFSLMKPDSIASYLFSALRAKFFVPKYIESELDKYNSECLVKSKLSEHEFEIRQKEVRENIEFVEFSKYEDFIKKSVNVLPDPKDSPYIALALSLSNRRFVRDTKNPSDFSVSIKASIWSNDPHLKKQKLVKVYTTEELINKLLKDEL